MTDRSLTPGADDNPTSNSIVANRGSTSNPPADDDSPSTLTDKDRIDIERLANAHREISKRWLLWLFRPQIAKKAKRLIRQNVDAIQATRGQSDDILDICKDSAVDLDRLGQAATQASKHAKEQVRKFRDLRKGIHWEPEKHPKGCREKATKAIHENVTVFVDWWQNIELSANNLATYSRKQIRVVRQDTIRSEWSDIQQQCDYYKDKIGEN